MTSPALFLSFFLSLCVSLSVSVCLSVCLSFSLCLSFSHCLSILVSRFAYYSCKFAHPLSDFRKNHCAHSDNTFRLQTQLKISLRQNKNSLRRHIIWSKHHTQTHTHTTLHVRGRYHTTTYMWVYVRKATLCMHLYMPNAWLCPHASACM